ncbi:hypothetical protein NE237_009822 [Protea cynaroides]|uniref:BHLH domain-containing protein n=1 Tax=Protea cynaroides TaxID=273540 RepID=A0A9Q0KY57_9MAGN|nr:hypothetical protein NE237_009822 [Protea cynaroides]
MDGAFVGMEDLEAFLAQDDLNYWPANASAGSGHMGSNLDDWWDLQEGLDSDLFPTLLEVNGSDIPTQQDQDLAGLLSYSLQEQDLQQGHQLLMEHIEQDHQQQHQDEKEEEEEEEVEEEEDGEEESDGKKHNTGRSRNLVFERKRRKRLNQQLMTLRSIVPNITKMDKRSILVDALGHLQKVLQETEKKLEELNLNSASSSSSSSGEESCTTIVENEAPSMETGTPECGRYALVPTVTKMEAFMLDEERFILKICCNKAVGAVGLVQKAVEMLGLQVTCASVDQHDHVQMLTTTFLRVKKKGAMTHEKLLQQLGTNAMKLGLLL